MVLLEIQPWNFGVWTKLPFTEGRGDAAGNWCILHISNRLTYRPGVPWKAAEIIGICSNNATFCSMWPKQEMRLSLVAQILLPEPELNLQRMCSATATSDILWQKLDMKANSLGMTPPLSPMAKSDLYSVYVHGSVDKQKETQMQKTPKQ